MTKKRASPLHIEVLMRKTKKLYDKSAQLALIYPKDQMVIDMRDNLERAVIAMSVISTRESND